MFYTESGVVVSQLGDLTPPPPPHRGSEKISLSGRCVPEGGAVSGKRGKKRGLAEKRAISGGLGGHCKVATRQLMVE